MSSVGQNIENPLELLQKTYNSQGNNNENSTQARPSVAKASIHQPSRKNSVHDVHEVTREELTKILIDIQEHLSRLRLLLETTSSVANIRDEFIKLKDHLLKKINEFIHKLATESIKRASINSKGHSSNLISHYPQYLVYSIEHFRGELLKALYLFYSLTLSASIGTATLNSITVKAIFDPDNDQVSSNAEDMQNFQDRNQIKKDISDLEDHIYLLNQRYYTQIPDWHPLDDGTGGTMTSNRRLSSVEGLNLHRFRFGPFNPKLSRTSSVASNENASFCGRIYRKCQMICCMCHPNYI